MLAFPVLTSLPLALGIFLISLVIVVATSARFTGKLEELCEAFNLSIGVLSLLSALGANIPNYVSSAIAIIAGQVDVGIGIIIGSNIYNMAIIPGLCTLLTRERVGITLDVQERRDVRLVAWYALLITLSSFVVMALLPDSPLMESIHDARLIMGLLFPFTAVIVLAIFGGLLVHILRRSHGDDGTALHQHDEHPRRKAPLSILRLSCEVLFTLALALSGVLVMVQSGQALTSDLHMPSVLAGLLVLAVATSLPNTVVAISLVRTGEVAACVEELWSSGSINTALGIVLPLLFWPGILGDHLLLLLDAPLTLALLVGMFFGVRWGRIGRGFGILLLVSYVAWVAIRFWV